MKISRGSFLLNFPVLTISINVHSACISLSIVVCVRLVWVAIVGAVVTAVTHIIAVIVILPGVVHEWTVVLFQKEKDKEEERVMHRFSGAVLVICHLSLSGSIYREG